ncbi:MAG: metallophosphoesterase [Myxococcales bacterium]|nr:metallophosphoesterase [Myxococcales bacterium]
MKCRVLVQLLLACAFVAAPRGAHAQTVVRGPYLQIGTPTSMTIVWRTDVASEGRVRYGESLAAMSGSADDSAVAVQHEVRITGLKPGTRYFYSVGTKSQALAGGDAAHAFRTSPTLGTRGPYRLWIVGDSGTGGSQQAAVRDAMLAHVGQSRPDLFLHMGDMAYNDGKDAEFQVGFFNMYQSILRDTVCWPTMGNHEGHSASSSTQSGPYYDAYVLPKAAEAGGLASGTEAYYSFDYANAHFVVLDSHDSPRSPTGAMLTWLKSDLAATSQPWVIAYWHHPPYTKGSHDSDTEGQLRDMRENALPILEAAGVDLVLGGHSHIYERSYLVQGAYATPTVAGNHIIDNGSGALDSSGGPYTKSGGAGAVYIVAGHGGTGVSRKGTHPLMFVTEAINGSTLVDIEGNVLRGRNVRFDGTVSDRFTLVKGDALVLSAPDGGESYTPGDPISVKWVTVGAAVAKVDVELSTDDGKTWTTVLSGITNSGSATFNAPAVDTQQARVRVRDSAQPSKVDGSDGAFTITSSAPRDVITFGDTWLYFDEGRDPGASWMDSGFDDKSWPSGAGQLGYGDNDEATKLFDASPNRPSVYFRKHITVDRAVAAAALRVLHDDGVAIWINGQRVFDRYIQGTDYASFATQTSNDNEISSATLDLTSQNPFVVGDNVIAVMVKQASATSSDLSFDLQLTLTLAPNTTQPDGGVADANPSVSDGSATDAGASDGAAASSDGTPKADDSGCSCSTPTTPSSALWLALLAVLALAWRRRRNRGPRPEARGPRPERG